MRTHTLGAGTLDVSMVCLGTMTFGEQNTEADAHRQLDYAIAHGVNFIDTAEVYPVMPRAETQGATERYVGSWLKKHGRRGDVVLATKVVGPNASMNWIRGGRSNFDASNIEAALEGSLRRLQTDYVDLYQLHWPSRNVPIFGATVFDPARERDSVPVEETLAVLGRLIEAGKIRYVGVSNESSWGVCEFVHQAEQNGLPRIVSIQNLYNLSARGFETSLLNETCFREQVSLLAYSPLAFGQLTAKYVDNPHAHGRLSIFPPTWSPRYMRPAVIAATKEYAVLARENGLTPTQMALAWCYSRWFVASTIVGATSLEQLKENIGAAAITLPPHVIDAINAIHARITNPGQ